MAANLQALLLRTTELRPALPTVALTPGCGLVLLPLTAEIVAELAPPAADEEPVDGFYELTGRVKEWARELSRQQDVGYLHSEFFGGTGFHAAMAWRAGAVGWGPQFTETQAGEAEAHYVVPADLRDMAGNALLRWLGVDRGSKFDEYAAAGLNPHRDTEDWAATIA